jgi:hypothetical protein
MSLLDSDFGDEIRALDDESADLSDEEREVFERLLREREWATKALFDGRLPASASRRAESARRELAALQLKREELLAEVIKAIRKRRRRGGGNGHVEQPGTVDRRGSGNRVRKKTARPARARRQEPST